MIHCSGGGQTKCLKYLPKALHIIKDNLFEVPPVFNLLQKSSGASDKEMYEVFNMGCRLELYCSKESADGFIKMAEAHGVQAQIIGRVEQSEQKKLTIVNKKETLEYYHQ
jgi:phosphoribosylformylglycinamidine cyclo-ligase